MHKILIVENDLTLAKSIKNALQELSTEIFIAKSINEAYGVLEKTRIDLVLLDRLLDDGDGIEIAEYIHDISFHTRIIILSSLNHVDERISGLKSGADLYLPKPFSKAMLKLYVEKALCTTKITSDEVVKVGPVVLSINTGEVNAPLLKCRLRKKEAEILAFLMLRRNQTISRDQLISGIWGSSIEIPTYSTIDAYIRKIRVSLGIYSGLIKTVRGFGYSAVNI